MSSALDEAYERLHATGPEWGGNLANHGPMAAEVLARRGHADDVHGWVDAYVRRLDDLPSPSEPISDATWPDAIGNGRIGDWTTYLSRQASERPWQDVLVTWWPRLLPGIAAGATHGVIRVGHAVRTLLAERDPTPAAVTELAHGLAYWAARSTTVPGVNSPTGELAPADALDAIPHIADQDGPIAGRLGRLADLSGWPASVEALAPADRRRRRAHPADRTGHRRDAALPRLRARQSGTADPHGNCAECRAAHAARIARATVGAEPVGFLGGQRGDHRDVRPVAGGVACRSARGVGQ